MSLANSIGAKFKFIKQNCESKLEHEQRVKKIAPKNLVEMKG